jgi:hypothetical protein
MKPDQIENDDIAKLLDAEKKRDELAPENVDADWEALRERVAATASGAAAAGASAAGASAWTSRVLWTTIGIAALTFGAGVGVGRSFGSKAPEAVTSSSAILIASTPASDPLVLDPAPLAELQHDAAIAIDPLGTRDHDRQLPIPATAQSATKAGSPSSLLTDERSLVEGARTALFRGRPSDALMMTEQHENLFPHGELTEDSDFLRVNALRDLGRLDEARNRAQVFLATYPHSALGGALKPLLASAPAQQTAPSPVTPPTSSASTAVTPDPPPDPPGVQMDPNAHGAY